MLPTTVAVAAPFPVPAALDPRAMAQSGLGHIRREVERRLAHPQLWSPEPRPATRRYRDFDSQLAARLRDAAPQWLLQADPDRLREQVARIALDDGPLPVSFVGTSLELHLAGADLGIMDFGFGTITLRFEVQPGTAGTAPSLDDGSAVFELIARLSPVVDRLAREACEAFPADLVFADRLSVGSDDEQQVRCLWGHDVLGFTASREVVLERFPDLAPCAELGDRPQVCIDGSWFVPGLGTSLLTDGPGDVESVARYIGLLQAYYASTANIERALSTRAAALTVQRPGYRGDAHRLAEIHELIEVVSTYRGSFTTLDIHLAASVAAESRVWQATSTIWRLDRQIDAIDGHVNALRDTAQHLAAERSASRANLITFAAFAFTVVATVSALLAVVDFSQGPALASPNQIRLLMAVAVVAVLAVVSLVLVRRLE